MVGIVAVSLAVVARTSSAAPPSSESCVECHAGLEQMHPEASVKDPQTGKEEVREITCVECHGGNGTQQQKAQAHVQPLNQAMFGLREYRKSSYAAINGEKPEFVRFMNPGDLRIADETCGQCHMEIVRSQRKNIMAHNSMVHNAVFYNNGAIDNKKPIYGEAFTRTGEPAELTDESELTPKLIERGALKRIIPHPEPKATIARDIFRVFDLGNIVAGGRNVGTDAKISVVYLNVLKTRLNDPSLWFVGTNEQSGDYRHSGCTACHSVYANDRDSFKTPDGKVIYHNGTIPDLFKSPEDFAKNGNKGVSRSGATVLPHDVGGFPVIHKLMTTIPTSQCITCHHHQGNGAILTYEGSIWWDYETDAARVRKVGGWAADQYAYASQLSKEQWLATMSKQDALAEHNREMKVVQFADQHGHSWNYRTVHKQDLHGNLLDASGKLVAEDDPDRFRKAVHMRDIHFEKGMHCIDCHTSQDMHGDGHIYAQMTDAIEIQCIDCHGTATKKATLKSSGVSGGRSFAKTRTGLGKLWFEWKDGKLIQSSKVYKGMTWVVPQVVESIDPKSPTYSAAAAYAMGIRKDGSWGDSAPTDESEIAHSNKSIECYSCHSSWNTVCSGCHLPFDPNIAAPDKHYLNQVTRGYAPYNGQVLRADYLSLGIGTYNKGYKISPYRSASSVIVSAKDRAGNMLVHQQPTLSTNGFSGYAMSPNMPHTVRKTETQACSSCHPSAKNDNNAWLSNLIGTGTNALNFVGQYAYVAAGSGGVTAVTVTQGEEPQPVIGSNFHNVLHPDDYKKFVSGGRKLPDGIHRPTTDARSVAIQGEFAFVADGEDGVAVYDIAFVANKAFTAAQRISDNKKAMFESGTRLDTEDAAYVALPSSTPMSLARNRKRDKADMEGEIHPLFGTAAVADRKEGLILFSTETFTDRNSENNQLSRLVTFNPDGKLTGAQMVRYVGNYLYLACGDNGLQVVDISNPKSPKLVGGVGAPAIQGARSVAVALRYAYVTDSEGLKVVDATDPGHPVAVSGAAVPIADARGVFLFRTTVLVAAGKDGLVLVDAEKVEKPKVLERFTADGAINDATGVTAGITNSSFFAYVADGKNGLRVVALAESIDSPRILGYAPPWKPKLIATYPTSGPAVAVADGAMRDRYVDESGNQIGASGRMGSRPFNRKEIEKFLKDGKGKVFQVANFEDLPADLKGRRAPAAARPAPAAAPEDAEEEPAPAPAPKKKAPAPKEQPGVLLQ